MGGMTDPALSPVSPVRILLEEDHDAYWAMREDKHPWQIERDAEIQAARLSVSTPEDLTRRRIEMRRLHEALDRMPHPSWGAAPPQRWPGIRVNTTLRYVADYVFDQLTTEERAHLSREMILADGERRHLSEWHDGLGNMGLSAGSGREGNPTEDEMRTLIEDLAEFRTTARCTSGEWSRVLDGLCLERWDNARIRRLFEEASGIGDETLWGLKESAEAHEEAREAVEALNERRDELHRAGRDCPRAHINWERFHPVPGVQLALPTLGEHVGAPEV